METTEGLELLQQLLKLTKRGVLHWSKAKGRGLDCYEASADGMTFAVEFIYFPRNDDVGSDRTMARVNSPGLIFDYCIGTQGFDLSCRMLSLNDKTGLRREIRAGLDMRN